MIKRLTMLGLAVLLVGLTGCARIRNLERKNANLQAQLESLQAERDELLTENQALKADRETLQAALTDARTEARRMSELVGELKAEQAKLHAQTAELRALLDEFGDIDIEARGEGNFIVMQSEILFDPGKVDLNPEATASLDRVAEYLLAHPQLPLRVDGHTDGVPIKHSPWKDNYHLAAMRAHSVMRYLVDRGVSPERMHVAGFGANMPRIEPPEPAEPMAANRRVELLLVPEGARSISEILEGFQE
jgi:chemotaxis protein MotB